MPKSPEDATTKDVLYPDDLAGKKLQIEAYAYWDASDEEDRAELPEDAQYGLFLPVNTTTGDDGRVWASAPRALRDDLMRHEVGEGDWFEVLEVEKGPADHDPYHLETRTVEEGDAL